MICMSFIPCRALINVNRNTVTSALSTRFAFRLWRTMIAIVDGQPAEVVRQLYLPGHPMRCKAAPEADEQLSLIDHCFRAFMSEH
jgi:hypothetical protein